MTEKPLLLVVNNNLLASEILGHALTEAFDVVHCLNRPRCRDLLQQLKNAPQVAIICLSSSHPEDSRDEELALIGELSEAIPTIKIVIPSSPKNDIKLRQCHTSKDVTFVSTPIDPSQLLNILNQGSANKSGNKWHKSEPGLIGESLPARELKLQLNQYANLVFPVLIEGESGCGKDIVASHHLHQLSTRHMLPFLAINCAAISPNLIEPTLFGHIKGAFTGATSARAGYFEEAGNGTLFLDEIGELPYELQPKLLRVLENGEYQRVGETRTRVSPARIIAATNRDLRREIKAGRFRADLYHRLSVFSVTVPPLREMGRDRLLLLEHFRQHYAAQTGCQAFTLNAAAEQLWLTYSFPGNIRELRNIVIRLTARWAGKNIGSEQLLAEFDTSAPTGLPVQESSTPPSLCGHSRLPALGHLQQAGRIDLDATLAELEHAYIAAALQMTRGNVSHASRLLGINRTTLYNRMEFLRRP
jgi:two-component system nitrogen regulation response regulator GlnG